MNHVFEIDQSQFFCYTYLQMSQRMNLYWAPYRLYRSSITERGGEEQIRHHAYLVPLS